MTHGPAVTGDARASLLCEVGDDLDAGVVSVAADLTITGWNHWLEKATGKQSAEMVGMSLRSLSPMFPLTALSAFERAVGGTTVLLSHALHGYLLDIAPPSGFERFDRMQQSVRILPLRDEGGAVVGAIALIQDVTERVGREDDLRAAMEDAQRANQAKSDFLAAMSHELRTPIGAMSGYADLLAGGIFGPVSTTQQEQLVRIKSVAAHLLRIVEGILTFARIEAGREEVHIVDTDAVALVRDAMVAVEPLAGQKKLEFVCRLPDGPVPVRTDEVKVRQILINLLGNAVKFTPSGSVSVELETSPSGMVNFAITDTGPGIAAADVTRIFEPFVQVTELSARTHEGSGLGLAVSRELARLLGGDLTVTSTLGVGSVFTVTIPV